MTPKETLPVHIFQVFNLSIPKSTNQMECENVKPNQGLGIHFCSIGMVFPIIQALPSRPPKGPAGQFDAWKKSPEKVKGIGKS